MNKAAPITLSSIAEIIQGGRLKLSGNDFVDSGFPAYGAGGLNGYLEVAEFNRPAIVLSSIGARCGKCFYVDGDWTSLANTQLIFPDLNRVDPKYLWYQLNDESSWIRSGTAQPFIKPSNVKARLVALPPLAEQRRIAAILDKADALRAKRSEAIVKLDELLRSVFIELCGDPIPGVSGGSERLADQVEITSGFAFKSEDFGSDGVPVVRISDLDGQQLRITGCARVPEGVVAGLDRFLLRDGDILMGLSGSIGKIGVVRQLASAAYLNQRVGCFRIRDGSPFTTEYLFQFLKMPSVQSAFVKASTGVAQLNISPVQLREFRLRAVDADRIRKYSQVAAAVGRQRERFLAQRNLLEREFLSLRRKVFSGGSQ